MNIHSTDIDREQKEKIDPEFTKAMIYYFASAFGLGCLIASFLIMGVLTFVDWIKG